MVISRCSWTVTRIGRFAVAVSLLGLTFDRTLLAFNYVVDANGTYWGIQDAASPGVDTGSIRATQIAPGGNNCLQHADQRVRRDQGPGGDEPASALQRRVDARLRPDLRRRRSLHDDDLGRSWWGHDFAIGVHQPQRQLRALARQLHQHHRQDAEDRRRVRGPIRHRHSRDVDDRGQHLQRRRTGHTGGLVGRGRDATGGQHAGRWPADHGDWHAEHARRSVQRGHDVCRQLALRQLQRPTGLHRP